MSEHPSGPAQSKPEEPKLSPAELKKRAKAEKQARRAAQKEQQGGTEGGAQSNSTGGLDTSRTSGASASSSSRPKGEKPHPGAKAASKQGEQDNKRPSSASHGSLPVRRRGSQATGDVKERSTKSTAELDMLKHLPSNTRRQTVEGVSKDVHPSVLTLGFKMSSYELCGSTARCTAMLLAFKDAIQEYTTPTGASLARHMSSHFLSPQIDFLRACRPISESMGNAIRWLKNLMIKIDPNTGEQEAKNYLCENIDKFIQERIVYTDQLIADETRKQINHGAVVLTYAKSAVVEKALLEAHADGTRFRVIVVDSRPLFEGRRLATTLMRAGVQVKYLLFNGIQQAVREATMAIFGAHAVLSNGMLQSRIGTASVAIAAFNAGLPVLVCCEAVKFSGKSVLDSLVLNEIAPPEELLLPSPTTLPSHSEQEKGGDGQEVRPKTLHDWKEIPNLYLLNLMYDVTPAQYLTQIICEYGTISTASVPAIHQITNEGE